MQVAINIKNIDLSMLNAIKAMLKTKPEIKFEIKKEQEILNNELEKDILEASYKNDSKIRIYDN